VTQRPLHAWVATSNVASIRVLEKCGFVRVGSHKNDVEELLFELRDSP
jgi:RimJ/RimL family protein N-acetyltransferase